jgi:nanoRNase/pAp phosphatase (c-di-AMP/oligoRNAs hydrolase)
VIDMLSLKSGSFAFIWRVDKTGIVKVGLRSQRPFSCIPLAESMGGGGYSHACGFKMAANGLTELATGIMRSAP